MPPLTLCICDYCWYADPSSRQRNPIIVTGGLPRYIIHLTTRPHFPSLTEPCQQSALFPHTQALQLNQRIPARSLTEARATKLPRSNQELFTAIFRGLLASLSRPATLLAPKPTTLRIPSLIKWSTAGPAVEALMAAVQEVFGQPLQTVPWKQ